ncbi:hypothetical protein [Streptomyces sp. NPDC002566]|uniref:hypothetical protein n=1 Tax=Streptomyces sp. NPDC002566 TaxID=3364650 RepID=UPI0036A96AFF
MRWLRELVALAGALAMAFAAVVLGATASVAGGPTSVLLASPTSRETASLYSTDDDYSRLDTLLHDSGGARAGGAGPSKTDEMTGRMINITWLAHDVHPWRVDRVYWLTPDDRGIWISTSGEASSAGAWHQPKDPARLRTLFTELGLMGGSAGTGSGGRSDAAEGPAAGAAKASSEPSAAAGEPVTRSAATGSPALGTGWWWAIPGLALGLALGFGRTLLARRAAAPEGSGPPHEPRQKLIDL